MRQSSVFVLVLTCLAAISATAQEKPTPDSAKLPGPIAELNLTPAQLTQYRQIQKENHPAMSAAQERLRTAHDSLESVLENNPEDQGAIQKAIAAIAQATTDFEASRASTEAKFLQLLTPDQKQRWKQARAQRVQEMQQRKEKRPTTTS